MTWAIPPLRPGRAPEAPPCPAAVYFRSIPQFDVVDPRSHCPGARHDGAAGCRVGGGAQEGGAYSQEYQLAHPPDGGWRSRLSASVHHGITPSSCTAAWACSWSRPPRAGRASAEAARRTRGRRRHSAGGDRGPDARPRSPSEPTAGAARHVPNEQAHCTTDDLPIDVRAIHAHADRREVAHKSPEVVRTKRWGMVSLNGKRRSSMPSRLSSPTSPDHA